MLAVMILLDRPVLWLARSLDPSVRHILDQITRLGDSSWSLLLSLSLVAFAAAAMRRACLRRRAALSRLKGAALYMFSVVALSGFVASLSKNIIGRVRPSAFDNPEVLVFHPMSFRAAHASFPSGHATTCMALAVGLAALFPRQRVAFLAIGLWGAASRALIGVHWLSDVIAGACLGGATACLLARQFARRGIAFHPFAADRPRPPRPRRFLGTVRRSALWPQR